MSLSIPWYVPSTPPPRATTVTLVFLKGKILTQNEDINNEDGLVCPLDDLPPSGGLPLPPLVLAGCLGIEVEQTGEEDTADGDSGGT